jgi:uncharacterized NAD(P)/FAD-binding protein YdhS
LVGGVKGIAVVGKGVVVIVVAAVGLVEGVAMGPSRVVVVETIEAVGAGFPTAQLLPVHRCRMVHIASNMVPLVLVEGTGAACRVHVARKE